MLRLPHLGNKSHKTICSPASPSAGLRIQGGYPSTAPSLADPSCPCQQSSAGRAQDKADTSKDSVLGRHCWKEEESPLAHSPTTFIISLHLITGLPREATKLTLPSSH